MWKMWRQFSVPQERSLCIGVYVYCNSCAHWSALQKPRDHGWFPLDCSQVRTPGRWSSGLPQSQHLLRLLGQPPVPGKQVHGWWLLFLKYKVVLSFSGLCRKFEVLFTTATCSWFFIFSSTSHPSSLTGSQCCRCLKGPFTFSPCGEQPRMSEVKDPAVRTTWIEQPWTAMWHQLGHFALQEQCPSRCSWSQGEGWSLPRGGSSRSLVMSVSHHRDNKDVWWDRTVAIWARAVLRLLFCFCSSLPRSLGYTTLGVRSIWQCCPVQPQKPPCTSLQLQPITLLPLRPPPGPMAQLVPLCWEKVLCRHLVSNICSKQLAQVLLNETP